jgi:hypothetical protein
MWNLFNQPQSVSTSPWNDLKRNSLKDFTTHSRSHQADNNLSPNFISLLEAKIPEVADD